MKVKLYYRLLTLSTAYV